MINPATDEDMDEARRIVQNRVGELVDGFGMTIRGAAQTLGIPKSTAYDNLVLFREAKHHKEMSEQGPRILFVDIETAPVKADVWALFKQDVGVNQINLDWYILSYSAKWAHEDQVYYKDKRSSYHNENDYELCFALWQYLDEADIVVAHNGKAFDFKKINARLIEHGFGPPSHYAVVDTLLVAKRHFAFTSNKLAFLTDKLNTRYKKLDHGKYPGHKLWTECLNGNLEAWQEMEEYNEYDVLSLEELYYTLLPWDSTHPNVALYYRDNLPRCRCGSTEMTWCGYVYTQVSKFDQFRCDSCGGNVRGRANLLSKDKRDSLVTQS